MVNEYTLTIKPMAAWVAAACLLMHGTVALGVACPSPSNNEILLNNNVAVTATCDIPDNTAIVVEPGSTISVTGASTAGIAIAANVNASGINNAGTIESTANAVQVFGTLGNVNAPGNIINQGSIIATGSTPGQPSEGVQLNGATVSGRIENQASARITSASGTALHIVGSSLTGTLSNLGNGEISSGNDTVAVLIDNSQIGGQILNQGYIGPSTGQIGRGILVTGNSTLAGITNTGTIEARNVAGNFIGQDALIISTSLVSGNIVNDGLIEATTAGSGMILRNGATLAGLLQNRATINAFSEALGVSYSTAYGVVNSGVTNALHGIFLDNASVGAAGVLNDTSGITHGDRGIAVHGGTVNGAITNRGLIDAASGGITLEEAAVVNGNLINAGSVTASQAGASGLLIDNSTVHGAVNNAGTLSGAAAGISVTATGVIDQGIFNTGTISAGSAGADALNLANTASAFTVTNQGVLNGNVQLGINRLDLMGTGTVNGNVVGAAGSIVNIGTTDQARATPFVASGNFSGLSQFNISAGSQLDSTNGLSIGAATLTNRGVISIAAGHTINLTGDYVQATGGLLRTGLSDAQTYGKLHVSGNVDLSASSKIDVDVINSPVLATGVVVPGVIVAGGTLSAGATIAVTDNSYLFDFLGLKNAQSVDLLIVAAAPPVPVAPPLTVVSAVTANANTPALGVAAVLDGLIATGTSGDMGQVITALGKLATARQVSDAASQTLPVATAATASAVAGILRQTDQVVQARIETNRGLSAGDGANERNVWGKPFGSWTDQRAQDGAAGYKAKSGGVIVGADAVVSQNDRLGMAFSYANANLDGKGTAPQSADIDLYQLMAYGSHSLDQRTDINWQADVGITRTDASRAISFGGLDRVATSDYHGTNWHVGSGIGRVIALDELNNVVPSLRLDYTMVRNQAYTENGAGALDLTVDRQTAKQFILSTMARLDHAITKSSTVSLNAGAGYDFLAKRDMVVAAFAGDGPAFTTYGARPNRAIIRGGLGLTSIADSGMEMTGRYDVESRGTFTNQALSFKLRREF